MEVNKKNLITSVIYSFKDNPFNMTDILYLVSATAQNRGCEISIEEICATVDALAEEGTIEVIIMPNGKSAIKLSDATLTKVLNEALNGQSR